jgi:hypothetical protein
MAELFILAGFELEREHWNDENTKNAFSKAILPETLKQIGGKGRAQAIQYGDRPATPCKILGIDANNQPYAWSFQTWR